MMCGILMSNVGLHRHLGLGLVACALVLVGCNSALSRGQAANLVRATLETKNVVSQIRVSGAALRELIDGGHIIVAEEQYRSFGRCSGVRAGGGPQPLFNKIEGNYCRELVPGTGNALILTLSAPLRPSNIQITGIAQDKQGTSAVVEFTFSYDPPAVIAGLTSTGQVSTFMGVHQEFFVRIWPGMANLFGLHSGRYMIQRYDDGWRVVS